LTTTDRTSVRVFAAVVRPLQAFIRLEAASGILLLMCAVVALVWANVHGASYQAAFDYPLAVAAGGSAASFTVRALINDGFMAVFFFVVGMEIKRELAIGELSSMSKASLPAVAALGGMLVPAGMFLALNWGQAGQRGWGIPMATDIAFCVGILTLLGDRVSRPLVVFVTALAIFDDIGGILVIAFFYGHGLSGTWLLVAVAVTAVSFAMNRAHLKSGLAWALAGAGLWLALHQGGIHATISGVVLGLMIPARARRSSRDVLHELAAHVSTLDEKPHDVELDAAQILAIEQKLEHLQAPLQRFVHLLHPLVAFGVMPVFALANSGVSLAGSGLSAAFAPVALGAAAGLFLGKQLGIFAFTLVAVKLRLAPMPGGASIAKLWGVSVIAGVGFTVALFIAGLAFADAPDLLNQSKLGIVLGSVAAGVTGFAILRLTARGRDPA
jgi:Na+:H+ antiporter, NhaA family